ncbi:MAG: hypothetical protein K6A82_09175 [Prevotella sp.]|nr:hypothetical protein [Prevotella sp.]
MDEKNSSAVNDVSSAKPSVYTRAVSSASDEVHLWTGDKVIHKKTNVKVLFSSAYRFYIQPGTYLCDVYRIRAVTPENESIIYRNAVDDACGFMPFKSTPTTIQRGTRAAQTDESENSYLLETICFRIISNTGGAQYPRDYYIPCKPEEAVLKFKQISF